MFGILYAFATAAASKTLKKFRSRLIHVYIAELERSTLLGPSTRDADERKCVSLPRPAHSERARVTVMQDML